MVPKSSCNGDLPKSNFLIWRLAVVRRFGCPSASILGSSNLKKGGKLIGVDMVLLDQKLLKTCLFRITYFDFHNSYTVFACSQPWFKAPLPHTGLTVSRIYWGKEECMSSVFLMLLEVTTISTSVFDSPSIPNFVELRNPTTCISTEMLWSRKYEQMTLADGSSWQQRLLVRCLWGDRSISTIYSDEIRPFSVLCWQFKCTCMLLFCLKLYMFGVALNSVCFGKTSNSSAGQPLFVLLCLTRS